MTMFKLTFVSFIGNLFSVIRQSSKEQNCIKIALKAVSNTCIVNILKILRDVIRTQAGASVAQW